MVTCGAQADAANQRLAHLTMTEPYFQQLARQYLNQVRDHQHAPQLPSVLEMHVSANSPQAMLYATLLAARGMQTARSCVTF